MINGRLLKQYDFPVALGITHLAAAALLLNSSKDIPAWVAQYGYFVATTLILLCCPIRSPKGFLTGIAAGILSATLIRLINDFFTNLHGPGVDFPMGLAGAILGVITAAIYAKENIVRNAERGFIIGLTGTLGGYLLTMALSCNTVIYCGPAFSWGTYP